MATIPNDLEEEILLKLPVKSLLRFVSVSKRWRSMIQSQHFVEKHMTRQRSLLTKVLFFTYWGAQCDHEYNASLTSMSREGEGYAYCSYILPHRIQHHLRFSGSCDGLVCFNDSMSTYVTNPATRELRKLPPANFQVSPRRTSPSDITEASIGIGRDNITDTHKVVMLYSEQDQGHYITKCEVFSLDGGVWRCIDPPIHGFVHSVPKPVYKGGCLYWFAHMYEEAKWQLKVIAFDLHEERFHVTPHPSFQEYESYKILFMFNHKGRDLRVITATTNAGDLRVWTLGQEKWEETKEREGLPFEGSCMRRCPLGDRFSPAFMQHPEFFSPFDGQEVNSYFDSLASVYR